MTGTAYIVAGVVILAISTCMFAVLLYLLHRWGKTF